MDHKEAKQLRDDMQSAFEALKKAVSTQDEEIKKFGHAMPETKTAIDRIGERLDTLETKLNRSPIDSGRDGRAEGPSEGEKAFELYLRKGAERMGPDEVKALSTDDNTSGGYLVPQNRETEIIEKLHLFSPIRELAAVETITIGNSLQIPAEGGTNFDAGWVGERQARTETASGKIRMEDIPTHELYANPRVSQRQLDDSGYDVAGYVDRKVAQRFGVIEGAAFVTGNGVNQPEGILSNSEIAVVNSGDAAKITADGIINLYHELPEFYARNATWLLRRLTVGAIRLLKDTQNRYLWEPSMVPGNPPTILGQPYRECPDMPAVAANAFPVLFGDIRALYTIVDRQGINVVRDPFSAKPFVEFYTTRRTGGQVVLAESARKLKIAA